MHILIIGGTRFVGDSLVRQLLAWGHRVTVFNRGRTPDLLPETVERLHGDVAHHESLAAALAGRHFDAVVHMIAYGREHTQAVLEILLDKTGHYLQCGSTGVYAPLRYCPADEEHPTDPPAEYGGFREKLQADEIARQMCEQRNVPCTILRPSNICGAGDVPLDIWGARNPRFFQRLLEGKIISIPNDGQALVQPVHKDDVARAFVLALDNPAPFRLYNVSSRYALTLNYYVDVVGDILGRKPVVEHVPMEELLRHYPDPEKLHPAGLKFLCVHMCFRLDRIQKDLGYEPQWTPEAGLEHSIAWMWEQGLLHKP